MRITLLVAAAAVVAGSLSGCAAGAAPTADAPTTAAAAPEVSAAPSPQATVTPIAPDPVRVNGFDVAQIYAACIALNPSHTLDPNGTDTPDPIRDNSVQPATPGQVLGDSASRDPNAVGVFVKWSDGTIEVCGASGDVTAPTVEYVHNWDAN